MATGVHIQEPVLDTLRREDENEKMMDQASYITLGKVPVGVNLGAGHTPIEPQDMLETNFDVKDSVEGNEGSASTIEGEEFLKSPSVAEVYFEENTNAPDACRVPENAEKMATEHDASHAGEAKLDAEESNGLEKGLVSALEVGSMREVGHDESKPVHEAGLSENREDRESTVPEEEAAQMESLNVNPEDSKACVTIHGTETTSSIEEKSMTSTPQVIPDDKIEQTTFETNDETPENVSAVVPNEESEQNSSIKVDDSQMKTDVNLEKEDEKPELTLIPEGKIKDDESTQIELFGTKDDTERLIQESEEEIEKRVESSPVAASEAEDTKATTSDHGETSALENQIPTENPQEIEGDKSECKTEKETLDEQVQDVSTLASVSSKNDAQGIGEAHLEKESEKPCSTDASTRDASHDETMPVDKTRTEDEEPSKSDLLETKEDTESTILAEEPIMEKHLESLNATPDDIKACDSVQDTETKSSIEEKLLTEAPQEISGDKIEKTAFDTKEETPEDISKVVSSEETEQNSIAEVPFVTEALTIDNELAITEGKIKDEDQREEDLLDNKNDTESELLKQEEVMEKHVESSKLANEAEDTKASTSDHDTKTSDFEHQILTENPQDIVGDETESKIVDTKNETLDVQKDASTIESNDDNDENSVIEKDESEKTFLREESTRDAAGDEPTYTHNDKIEGEDQRRAESLIEEATIVKLVESPQVDAEEIKTHVSDQDAEKTGLVLAFEGKSNDGDSAVKDEVKTEDNDQKEDELSDYEAEDTKVSMSDHDTKTSALENQILTENPQEIVGDETESKTCDVVDTKKENLDVQDVSKIESNDDNEENSVIEEDESEKPLLREESTRNAAGDESTYTHKDQIEGKNERRAELFENPSSAESISLIEEATIPKLVESPPVDAEDIKTHVSDQDAEETGLVLAFEGKSNDDDSAVKDEGKTEDSDQREDKLCDNDAEDTKVSMSDHTRTSALENPQEIVADETESKTCDVVDKKQETLDAQDVSTIESNDDNKENSVVEEDESEKPLLREESTRDAAGDESTYTHEDKIEGEDQRRAELFENPRSAESTSLIEDATIQKLVESPQVDAEDIKTHVSDQDAEKPGLVLAFEGKSSDGESVVKYEVKSEDGDQKEDELCDNEKNPESSVLLEAAQTETTIGSSQETLPSTVPGGFLDDQTEEKTADAIQKDEDIQNVTTVSNEKIEENSLIPMDGSQTQHEENLEKENEIPSVIEASTKHANDDELIIINEDNLEHEEPRKVEMLESEKDTETNLKNEAQIETHIKSLHVATEDIVASDSYQGTETTNSQEERILNENEIVHEQTEVEKLDTADTMKETPEALDVSTTVLNDDNEENTVIGEDDSQTKNEENLGKESEKPPFIEASRTDASGDESTGEDKIEGEEHKRVELFEDKKDTESTLLKEEETVAQLLESPQVDAVDIKTYVSDQVTETTGLVEVFKGVANDEEPEVKCTIKTEEKDQKEDGLCDIEKISDSTLLPEVTVMEKPFKSLKEAFPTLVPRGFLDEKTEEKTIDATEKDEETHETQNVATIVSNENAEDDSLLEVDGSQMQCKEYLEEESEITQVVEASTMNANDDDSINVHEDNIEHEDLRKDELAESKEDTKITSQKEEARVETPVKPLNIAADDIVVSDSCQETETSSQEERILNKEEIVSKQIEVKTLDTKTKTPEAQDVSTIVPDHSEENSGTGENDLQIKNDENFEEEREKPSVTKASMTDASGDGSTNKCEDKTQDEEHTGAQLFEGKKDAEGTLLKEEEIKVKLLESPQVDIEDIKTYVSDEGVVEASEEDANNDESAVKYEVKTEDNDQKEDEKSDNEIGVLLEAAQIESLQETPPSTVPRGFLDDNTEEKTADAVQKDEDIQNVTTVSNEKTEENSLIPTDGSQIHHEEHLEKEHEIPSVIEASTKHANDDELIIINEDNLEHEDLRKVEMLESEKDTEINLQKNEAQIETHIKSLQVAAEDIIASDSYQGTGTTKSQEERILNENEIVHEQTEVEKLDTADTMKETPEAQDVSTIVLNDDDEENSVIGEDDSQMKNEENLAKESENPPFIEASRMDASGDESTGEDKIEGEEQARAELFEDKKDTENTVSKEEETVVHTLASPQVDAEDIKTYVSDQVVETTTPVEVFKGVANDEEPEVKYTIKTEDKDQKEDELCDNEKILDSTRGFLDEKTEEKTIDATEKDKETHETQNVATIVSNENAEDDSLLEVDGSQMKCKEYSEEESEITPIVETSTLNVNEDDSINVHEDSIEHEDPRKDELVESKEDTEIILQKEEAQVETPVKSLNIAADDIIASDSYQETETSSQDGRILNKEEFVCEQIEVETLDTKSKTLEAQDVSIIVPDDTEENSGTGENDLQVTNEENFGGEREKPSVTEASTTDASGGSTNKCDQGEEHKGADLFEGKKDMEGTLLKEEEIKVKLVESPQVDIEDIKTYVSDEGIVEVFEGDANNDESAVKYKVKTEDNDQKEDEISDNEKNPEIGVLLEAAQIESLKETLPSTVPRGFLDEKTEETTIDAIEKDKEILDIQNVAITVSDEKIEGNSLIQEDSSQIQHEEYSEKESDIPSVIEASTKHANDEELIIIHEGNIEHDDLRKVELLESNKDAEIDLQEDKIQIETPVKSMQEATEDIIESDSYRGMETTSSQEERTVNEDEIMHEQREVETLDTADTKKETTEAQNFASIHSDENNKENSWIQEDGLELKHEELLEKESKTPSLSETLTMEANDEETTIIHQDKIEDEKLEKVDKLDCNKHEEVTLLNQEAPVEQLNESSKEDLEDIDDFVSGADTTEKSLIEVQSLNETPREIVGDHMEENIVDKDPEEIDDEHLDKDVTFENEKHTEMSFTKEEEPMKKLHEPEKKDLEDIKAFVLHEGTDTKGSIEERDLTEISQESVGDPLEDTILAKAREIPDFTPIVSDEHAEKNSSIQPYGSQVKHVELTETETSFLNSSDNESTAVHEEKIENEHLNKVDIAITNDEAPVEELQESSKRDLKEVKETISIDEQGLTEISQETVGDQLEEKTLDKVGTPREFTNIVSDENGEDVSLIPVDGLQIKHEELLEKESETPPLSLPNSSNEKLIEHEVPEKADKSECVESGEATLLNEEASAEKLIESSKDLEDIKESITCEYTEITSSTQDQNLTTISQAVVDDRVEEKVLNVALEASDFTTIIPDNNTERNLLVEVDGSQIKNEEHLEKESEMPSLLMSNTSTEEPTIVHENKITEHAEIILSNEEALENSSKEENENIKASVSCEDTETSSVEQQSLIANPHEIVGDQIKEKIIDIAQDAPDCRIDDQDLRKVYEFEPEINTEAISLKEPTPAEKVIESTKEDLGDTKVFPSCEDKETRSSTEERSQKANQQETVVDQTQENILDSATKAQDFKQTVSHENAGENSLIQVDESQVKYEIVGDPTQENVVDTAPEDQDFEPAISHENAEEHALIQVDELQKKDDESEKENEKPSFLLVDTSNKEPRIIYEDITEDENLKKVHDFECEKHEEITSTEEEAQVRKVNESSKEDLQDIKALFSGEDTETTSFIEKQSLKENPREVLSDQQEEKILGIAPEAQNFIKVVSNENVEKDSLIQEDGSQMAHEEILEEGETPSLSAALMLNTTDDDSIVIHEKKIENEDLRKVDIFECEKHVDDKIVDAASEAPEFKIIVSDENTEEKSLDQYDKSQVKHEELLEKESKTLSLSETSLLISSNEDSTTINEDKIEDEDPDKVDNLECQKHTEFPLTEKEAPSSMEDPNLQTKPQEVVGDQMEENIIDITPEIQNFTTIVLDENTKENLSLDVDESPIKHEELSENESEKPSLSSLKTSNEESSFICDSKTENEDVNRDEKLECVGDKQITESKNESSVEKLDDYPKEGPESIKVSVSSEDKELTGPLEERSLTANPQENLTKDKIPVVPEAPELKTIVSDKNIEENSIILEDGSKMKYEERSEKEREIPSLMETSILNTRNDEPALLLDDKIENEDQAKVDKSECEKHAEITEVPMGNLNSSNLENIEAFVSCGDIETTNSTEEQNLTVNPIENVGGQNGEKVLDKVLEAQDFTPIVTDDNNEGNSLIQVDESQMKHEEPLEEESKLPSLLETSLLNTNNEESATIHKDKIEDEALKNVDELESEKNSEINKLEEESMAYKDIKANVSYQGTDTEASALQDQILTANPQDILGNKSEDQDIDTADSKDKITENLTVSKENVVQDSLIQMDESEVKHEEILEKESEIQYLTKPSTVEANKESTIIHEDMIEEESGKNVESTLLNEGSQANESVESLQVASEDIKASVSCQNSDTTSSILNADPQEIAEGQTDDNINIAGTREITPEALNLTTLVSKENEVQDSFTPQDGLRIKYEDISEKESEVQFLTNTSMLTDNDEESMIIQEDTIGGEDLKKFDTFKSAKQTENILLKEEAHVDESMEFLQVESEHIKAYVSCQDTDPTSSLKERILTTTPQETVGDQVEEKVTDTAKAWEKTPEVTTSIFVFQEDEANRTRADDINSGMTKDGETLNRDTVSNAAENDEICASDKVQAKEEEKEIISERKSDKEADKDDSWIKLTEDGANKTCIEVKKIDFSFHAKDTSDVAQHDDAKDIPKGSENSTAENEFLEEGYSKESTEPTASIVSKDLEQSDKDIKAETVITETGTASDALPITGVQYGQEENESEDSKTTEIETSLAPEGGENQVQLTKLIESPLLSHVKDSEQEITENRGTDNLQSGSDIIDDMQELDEGFVAISNKGNFFEANSNEDIETDVTTGGKETSAIHKDLASKFVEQEIQEQPGKTVEDVSEERGIKSEEGKIKYDDSDDLINSSILETDKDAPSDIVCGSTSDVGQRAVDQGTQVVMQEEEQRPGKGKAIAAVPDDKGINVEADEIKEHDFNVLKENSSIVALDKVTPVNFFQGSTTETPEQHGLDQAGLKEIEAYPASTTDKLTVLKAEQTDNANFDSSVGSNKISVLQDGDSSESSQAEGEKQKTLKLEKGEKCENKETAKPMETSESTETDKPSLSGLLQEPVKEVSKIVDHLVEKKEPTTHKDELPTGKSDEADHVEAKIDEEKYGEEESGEHQISGLSSDTPVMVDAGDRDVKIAHKKSHNILSGVGSKVKHSISKVRKAITGKSSHPKSASPKYSEKI